MLPLIGTDDNVYELSDISCGLCISPEGPIATSGGRKMAVFGDEQDTGLSPNCKAHCVCSTQCAVYHQLIQLHRVSWPERRVGCIQMSVDGV